MRQGWVTSPINAECNKLKEEKKMKTTRVFADGIERKLTLAEFLRNEVDKEAYVVVDSYRDGIWIEGSAEYCYDHLDKWNKQMCVQSAVLDNEIVTISMR